MAVTKIYAIKTTPQYSIDYDKNDKESFIIKNDSADSLNYIMRDKNGVLTELSQDYLQKMKAYISIKNDQVTFETITTAINCSVSDTYHEWDAVRKRTEGNSGNLQYCIVQNFGTDLDPLRANEIGVKFAEEYLADYQCIVSTHINTGYVHNHIEFNATSFVTGKKYHDCLNSISEIRKISDRLCKEYGLEVLENTSEFKLRRYKDSEGNTKYFEPTERKNALAQNSNLKKFEASSEFKKSHIEELKSDIEKFIVYVDSYEELLQQLKNIGYEIKDKTQKDQYRKHITFKKVEWDKGTRDSSLGEEYTRELLTERIKNQVKDKNKTRENNSEPVTIIETHDVPKDTVNNNLILNLDEEYRYKKKKDEENNYIRIPRSRLEKLIIVEIKKSHNELETIMSKSLEIEKHYREQTLASDNKRKQYLMDRINGNLKTLKFVEDKEIKSVAQINSIVSSLFAQRNQIYKTLGEYSKQLDVANYGLSLITKHEELKKRIEANRDNENYAADEIEIDQELLNESTQRLKSLNLYNVNEQEKFKALCENWNSKFVELQERMKAINSELKEYDECVFNLKYVDRGRMYESEFEEYETLKENEEAERE